MLVLRITKKTDSFYIELSRGKRHDDYIILLRAVRLYQGDSTAVRGNENLGIRRRFYCTIIRVVAVTASFELILQVFFVRRTL